VETHVLAQKKKGPGPKITGTVQLKAFVVDLAYEASTGNQAFSLEVVRAVGLASADKGARGKKGSSDPFVNVWWDGRPVGQTEIVYNKTSPQWGETFTIPLVPNWQKHFQELKVEIFDSDEFEQNKNGKVVKVMQSGKDGRDAADGDDFLGMAVLTAEDVLRMASTATGAGKEHEFKLQPQPGQKGKMVKGSVFLRGAVIERRSKRQSIVETGPVAHEGDCVRLQICGAKKLKKADRTGEMFTCIV
jgi:hypothetical protein